MPLGKLSQKQLLEAYSVLKDALELVQKEDKDGVKGPNSRSKFIELTNRFFTLVPHDFGMDQPPILNTEDLIKVCLFAILSSIDSFQTNFRFGLLITLKHYVLILILFLVSKK